MSIISALPFTLVNGTTADATQVMADFNQIVTNVNNNALPNTGGALTSTAITLSTIDSSPIGATTPSTGAFTSLSTTAAATIGGALTTTGLTTANGGLTLGKLLTYAAPVTVASAATVDLGAQTSNIITITGTTTITSFGTTAIAGQIYELTFTGSLTLTYNATTLILPTAANIQTNAGDVMQVLALGSGDFTTLGYLRENGLPVGGSASIQGSAKNLKGVWDSSAQATWTADQVIVQTAAGIPQLLTSFSQSPDTAVSGAGGLDTGSIAASTWYNVFAIYGTAGTSSLISLSATSPVLPTGYTYFGRIGSFLTNASALIMGFVQYGRDTQYKNGTGFTGLPVLASGSFGGGYTVGANVAVYVGGYVPPTASKIALSLYSDGSNTLVAPNANYGARDTFGNNTLWSQSSNGFAGSNIGEIVLETMDIYASSDGGSNYIYCLGYTDNL